MSVWLGPGVSRYLARRYSGVSVMFACGISTGVCRLSEADEAKGGRQDAEWGHHRLLGLGRQTVGLLSLHNHFS